LRASQGKPLIRKRKHQTVKKISIKKNFIDRSIDEMLHRSLMIW